MLATTDFSVISKQIFRDETSASPNYLNMNSINPWSARNVRERLMKHICSGPAYLKARNVRRKGETPPGVVSPLARRSNAVIFRTARLLSSPSRAQSAATRAERALPQMLDRCAPATASDVVSGQDQNYPAHRPAHGYVPCLSLRNRRHQLQVGAWRCYRLLR